MFRTTVFLPLAALACLGQAAGAPLTFSRAFNLYDDYTQYLYSTVNTDVHSERVAGDATFWRATPVNTWGEVVYRFPVSFRIQSATLEAEIAAFSGGGGQPNFDPLAEAHLDVSTDGVDWTTVASRTPGNGGYWRGPADITELVAGANTVYVRARLFSTRNWPVDGAIFAQFMRTGRTAPVADGGRPSLDFQAVGVPEPNTMILAVIGLLGVMGGIGKPPTMVLFCAVHDRPAVRDADHAGQAEWTTQHVLGKVFKSEGVIGLVVHVDERFSCGMGQKPPVVAKADPQPLDRSGVGRRADHRTAGAADFEARTEKNSCGT